MKRGLSILLVGMGCLYLPGCGSSTASDDGLKGPPPPTIQADPGMKAPEDRPGMKKDGGAAGAG
jgi:hypothetical protein